MNLKSSIELEVQLDLKFRKKIFHVCSIDSPAFGSSNTACEFFNMVAFLPKLSVIGPVLCRPLHIAARKGLATVVQVLLSRGAAVMAVDEDGKQE